LLVCYIFRRKSTTIFSCGFRSLSDNITSQNRNEDYFTKLKTPLRYFGERKKLETPLLVKGEGKG